jgi:hypothetical protein
MAINHYQHLSEKITQIEKERKSLNAKISRLKAKNGGMYPPGIAAISKTAHSKLIAVISLQDQLSKIEA